jgi:hypothetical protein
LSPWKLAPRTGSGKRYSETRRLSLAGSHSADWVVWDMSAPLFADLVLRHAALRETFLAFHESVEIALAHSEDTLLLCRSRREHTAESRDHL